jgi:hypothetical protein
LLDLQTALGRLVRVSAAADPFEGLRLDPGERAWLDALADSAGFRFTIDVQRSWCAGRSAKAAQLTLSVLPLDERRRLVREWVEAGGGTASFHTLEADAFLEFIGRYLPDPSHALTLCQVERAALRAREGALQFPVTGPPWAAAADCALRLGTHAAVVYFHAEPRLVQAALDEGSPLPPASPETSIPVLFGPGLNGFSRLATADEAALWERLTVPAALGVLLQEGHPQDVIETMVAAGVIEAQPCN